MSKIGVVPVKIPEGVKVSIDERIVKVDGPKGTMEVPFQPGITVTVDENLLKVDSKVESVENAKAYWGLMRSLVNNAIVGVSEGFSKDLELVGIGYRVEKVGNDLKFSVGYSHPVDVKAPSGIEFEVEGNTEVKIKGIDKQLVGQVAANIRSIRKPEPYKGKGIKYKDEIVRRKPGKTAKATA